VTREYVELVTSVQNTFCTEQLGWVDRDEWLGLGLINGRPVSVISVRMSVPSSTVEAGEHFASCGVDLE